MNVGPAQALPADGIVQIAFDRFLLPVTAVRQSFELLDVNGNALNPVVTYDPVRRIVSLSNPNGTGSWLTPGQAYRLILSLPKNATDDESGLRAIDGATLDPSEAGEIGFQASAPIGASGVDSKMSFCADVLPIFQARCSAGSCHGAPTSQPPNERFPDGNTRPAAGLLLETSDGVRATAIGRVAQGSNTGATAGAGAAPGPKFGIDMPLVDPGDPGNSWMMYKLLLAPLPTQDAGVLTSTSCSGAPVQPALVPPSLVTFSELSDDERARLGDLVLGNQMPYPPQPGLDDRSQNLSSQELERVRAWIAQGAQVDDCSACQ